MTAEAPTEALAVADSLKDADALSDIDGCADIDAEGRVGAGAVRPGPAGDLHLRTRRWPLRLRTVLGLVLAAGALVCWMFVAEPVRVQSSSMAPTLDDGDRIIVNKLAYRVHDPRSGDVIVLEAPDDAGLVVKRVVAVGGDEVGIEDGVLVVNGVARSEAYVDQETIDGVYFGPVEVPVGTVFVMGDNRAESVDSREYGAVSIDDVVGRVSWRVWPLG